MVVSEYTFFRRSRSPSMRERSFGFLGSSTRPLGPFITETGNKRSAAFCSSGPQASMNCPVLLTFSRRRNFLISSIGTPLPRSSLRASPLSDLLPLLQLRRASSTSCCCALDSGGGGKTWSMSVLYATPSLPRPFGARIFW